MRVVGVCVSGGIQKTFERMGKELEEKEEGIKTLIKEVISMRE